MLYSGGVHQLGASTAASTPQTVTSDSAVNTAEITKKLDSISEQVRWFLILFVCCCCAFHSLFNKQVSIAIEHELDVSEELTCIQHLILALGHLLKSIMSRERLKPPTVQSLVIDSTTDLFIGLFMYILLSSLNYFLYKSTLDIIEYILLQLQDSSVVGCLPEDQEVCGSSLYHGILLWR